MEQDVPRAALAVMEIDNIVAASFGENGKRCYKVQWKESWVFEDHLFSCKTLVEKFWKDQKQDPSTLSIPQIGPGRGTKRNAKSGGVKNNMKVIVISNKDKNGAIAQPQQVDNGTTSEIDGDWILDGLNQDDDSAKENDGSSWFVTSETKKIRPVGAKYTLSCHICADEEFEVVSAFRKHYNIMHPGVKPFSCDVCQKRFDRKENLIRHIRIHTGDRRYICNFCGKGYTDPSGLKKHVNAKHPSENKNASENRIFKCDICQKTFTNKVILVKHFEQHDLNDQFVDTTTITEPPDHEPADDGGDSEETIELHIDSEISVIQKPASVERNMDQSQVVVADHETTTLEVLMEKSPPILDSSTTSIASATNIVVETSDIKDTQQPIQKVVQQLQQFVDEQVVQYVQVTNTTNCVTTEQTQTQPITLNSPTHQQHQHQHVAKTFLFDDSTTTTRGQQQHFVIPISAPQILINPAGSQDNLRQVLPAVANHQPQIITVPLTPASSFVYTGPLPPHHQAPSEQTTDDSIISDGT